MNHVEKRNSSVAMISGIFGVTVGVVQLIFSVLLLVGIVFAVFLGTVEGLMRAMGDAITDQPSEFAVFFRVAIVFFFGSLLLSISSIFMACRCFYARRVPVYGTVWCALICLVVAALRYLNGSVHDANVYAGLGALYLLFVFADSWMNGSSPSSALTEPGDSSDASA